VAAGILHVTSFYMSVLIASVTIYLCVVYSCFRPFFFLMFPSIYLLKFGKLD
jgi:hypothetical protein